jgi:hypothetical protein
LPFFQCPIVCIGSLNDLPVGEIVLPSPAGIGFVNVPSMIPITAVNSPQAIRMGCSLMYMNLNPA